jgi:hypothetical protein
MNSLRFYLLVEDTDYFTRFQIKYQDESFALQAGEGLIGKAFTSGRHVSLMEWGENDVHCMAMAVFFFFFFFFFVVRSESVELML